MSRDPSRGRLRQGSSVTCAHGARGRVGSGVSPTGAVREGALGSHWYLAEARRSHSCPPSVRRCVQEPYVSARHSGAAHPRVWSVLEGSCDSDLWSWVVWCIPLSWDQVTEPKKGSLERSGLRLTEEGEELTEPGREESTVPRGA